MNGGLFIEAVEAGRSAAFFAHTSSRQRPCRGYVHAMRPSLILIALSCLMTLLGCVSPMVSVQPPTPPAAQQRDRAECAAIAARAAMDYAWSPLADLAAVRADREAECLEGRGYATTTRVVMPPTTGDPQAPPDPVRRCFQQAFAWLGRYDGPVDGRPNVIWTAAQQAYLSEQQIMHDLPNPAQVVRESLQRDLQPLGRAADWQTCLTEATKPQ
jgi:hypothetical protein